MMSNPISTSNNKTLKDLILVLRKYIEDFNADSNTYHRIKNIIMHGTHGSCVTYPENRENMRVVAVIELKDVEIIPENKDDENRIGRDLKKLTACNNISIMLSELYFKRANIAYISVNDQ